MEQLQKSEIRGSSTREAQKAETRRRILAAARSVFAREGYSSASLSEIAEEAQVAKGSLFRHVESKAELFVETILDQNRQLDRELDMVVATLCGSGTPSEQVAAALRARADFARRNPDYVPLYSIIDRQDLIGELPRDLIDRVKKRWMLQLKGLEALVQRGIDVGEFVDCDPWVAANVLWSSVNFACELNFAHERRRTLGRSVETYSDLFLGLLHRGLLSKAGSQLAAASDAGECAEDTEMAS